MERIEEKQDETNIGNKEEYFTESSNKQRRFGYANGHGQRNNAITKKCLGVYRQTKTTRKTSAVTPVRWDNHKNLGIL